MRIPVFLCFPLLLIQLSGVKADDFAITVPEPGVYRVSFESLQLTDNQYESLRLTLNSKEVPVWLSDLDQDGIFSAGDSVFFAILPTAAGNPENSSFPATFRLQPLQGKIGKSKQASFSSKNEITHHFILETVFEENLLRKGFPTPDFLKSDHFFWTELSSLDLAAFEIFSGANLHPWMLDEKSRGSLEVNVRGATTISDRSVDLPDHQLVIGQRKDQVAKKSWNSSYSQKFLFENIQISSPEDNLTLRVPARQTQAGDFIADIVFLNTAIWRAPLVNPVPDQLKGQLKLSAPLDSNGNASFQLPLDEGAFTLYTAKGERWQCNSGRGVYEIPVRMPDTRGDGSWILTKTGSGKKPSSIRPWKNDDLSGSISAETDHLIVVPEMLLEEVEPLARMHRSKGMKSAIVSVEDLYDTYGHGTPSPEAIQSAVKSWIKLRPEGRENFLLLAGDSSWEPVGTGRNLIPTWHHQIRGTLCASDHPYACVDGEDFLPDLAVGRLPAGTPEEMRALISKIVSAGSANRQPGNSATALLIVDHEANNAKTAAGLKSTMEKAKIKSVSVIAKAGEESSDRMETLKTELIKGRNWTFYYGHGTRQLWQTGPVDFANQSSLFSADDLSDLCRARPYPPASVTFSMTCDSAPFDHPEEDSIGERFVTVPGGGSLCFIGASWRIRNDPEFLKYWTDSIVNGKTVGMAFLRAKNKLRSRQVLESYNLLGDPATPLR